MYMVRGALVEKDASTREYVHGVGIMHVWHCGLSAFRSTANTAFQEMQVARIKHLRPIVLLQTTRGGRLEQRLLTFARPAQRPTPTA